MARKTKEKDGAQNQHYVPKFILRNFLSDEAKEQVTVFDKKTGKTFTPNISGIMAERKFHDFQVTEEYAASFEQSAGRVEDALLPTYRRILAERRLRNDAEEQAHLALLVAFQFLRTRRQRDRFVELESLISKKLEKMGNKLSDIENYSPFTEDSLKLQHAGFITKAIGDFAKAISEKHFMIIGSAAERDFYVSDNPVVLHNDEDLGPYGNLGIAVRGIQIYLPLSHDLLLACLCPTILNGAIETLDRNINEVRSALLPLVLAGKITGEQMREKIDQVRANGGRIKRWHQKFIEGVPDECSGENMDFYNSLQMGQSRQFVISKRGDFALAKRFMSDFPFEQHVGLNLKSF
jgi:hypothetical protein